VSHWRRSSAPSAHSGSRVGADGFEDFVDLNQRDVALAQRPESRSSSARPVGEVYRYE
jgi:hypothetical protein